MALGGQGTLKDFISSFGTNKDLNKGVFPYDLLTIENYEEVLSKTEPFSKEDFNNMLKNSVMSDKEYAEYLEDVKKFKTPWDYLQYYNELDTKSMISPLDNFIELYWKDEIDFLRKYLFHQMLVH